MAPWVWAVQGAIGVWYLTGGHELAEAQQLRERMGEWDSEWSLRHMLRVLQSATLNATIDPNSADQPQLLDWLQTLKNWALLAA